MANGDSQDPTSSSVWNRLDQHGDQIGSLAQSQATTEANLAALAQSVDTGFQTVNRSLNRLAERETRPTNWIGLGLALIALLGGMVTFVSLVVAPVKTDVATLKNSDAIQSQELADRAFTLGRLDADMEWIKKDIEKD